MVQSYICFRIIKMSKIQFLRVISIEHNKRDTIGPMQVKEINGLTQTPRYTGGGIRCLGGVSILCRPVTPAVNLVC
jgi:hypothetical protein